ncbi:MAG TPA: hypothetical protein VH475_22645 [Tepidisphaeraceae bacterium]|jgi:hypothetical protein
MHDEHNDEDDQGMDQDDLNNTQRDGGQLEDDYWDDADDLTIRYRPKYRAPRRIEAGNARAADAADSGKQAATLKELLERLAEEVARRLGRDNADVDRAPADGKRANTTDDGNERQGH